MTTGARAAAGERWGWGLLAAAMALWLVGMASFWKNGPVLYYDALSYAKYANLFFGAVERLVYPLWDPFTFWGRPAGLVMSRAIGVWNPFYLLIPLLGKAGVSFGASYVVFLLTYFLFGVAGFYGLLLRLYRSAPAALAGSCLLLFSTLGHNIFNDTQVVFMVTGAVWFFYALLRFRTEPSSRTLIMVMFWGMINIVTYIPFPFLTLGFFALLAGAALFPAGLGAMARDAFRLCRTDRRLSLLVVGCACVTLLPALLWFLSTLGGDYVWEGRSAVVTGGAMGRLSIVDINAGGHVLGYHDIRSLFSSWDRLTLVNFTAPLIALPLLLAGAWARVGRMAVFAVVMALSVILVSLGNASWPHGVFYRVLFWFSYYRNLHYFIWMAVPFLALLAADVYYRLFVGDQAALSGRGRVAAVVSAHALTAGLVYWLGDHVPAPVPVILVCSAVYFTGLALGRIRGLAAAVLFLALAAGNMLPVFGSVARRSADLTAKADIARAGRPEFRYVRPSEDALGEVSPVGATSDMSGFDVYQGWFRGGRKAYGLWKNIARKDLEPYVRHKFMVYTRTQSMPEPDAAALARCFRDRCGTAYFHGPDKSAVLDGPERPPLEVTGPGDGVRVTAFDLNSIRFATDFSQARFVVYNDTFDPGWRAVVNGRPARIYWANGAFKGLLLPPGHNEVVLSFRAPFQHGLRFLLLFVFYLLGIWLMITAFMKENPWQRKR